MNETPLAAIYNYRAVDETLGTSGQPSMAQLGDIAAAGFHTIINLALHDDPRYSLPDEAGAANSLGLAYIHIPVQFASPTESDLLAFFDAMQENNGKKIWIHCAANMRVSVFLGLYRILRQGWQDEAAFALMYGLWQPNEIWSTFIANMLAKHRS